MAPRSTTYRRAVYDILRKHGLSLVAGPGNILIKIGADAGQAVRELGTVDKALGSTMTTSEKMGAGIKKAALPAAAALGAIGYRRDRRDESRDRGRRRARAPSRRAEAHGRRRPSGGQEHGGLD